MSKRYRLYNGKNFLGYVYDTLLINKEFSNFKSKVMTNNIKNVEDRLKKFRDANPSFANAIEETFPEIKDREPFVFGGEIFMKRQYKNALYILNYCKSQNIFFMYNLKHRTRWASTIKPSNPLPKIPVPKFGHYEPFLTEGDLEKLFRSSQTNLKECRLVEYKDIDCLHQLVFSRD